MGGLIGTATVTKDGLMSAEDKGLRRYFNTTKHTILCRVNKKQGGLFSAEIASIVSTHSCTLIILSLSFDSESKKTLAYAEKLANKNSGILGSGLYIYIYEDEEYVYLTFRRGGVTHMLNVLHLINSDIMMNTLDSLPNNAIAVNLI